MAALHSDELVRHTLGAVAPGTELRDGLERILRGRTGASSSSDTTGSWTRSRLGGFPLDVEFSATRLRELAKMDGAVVVDRDVTRIVRAATQLLPDASIETSESGTRHRTAERVAKQTGFPVVTVSQSMRIVALYVAGRRIVLEDSSAILSRANQALQTLERYKKRLDEVTGTLSALEIEDLVSVRDVANVLQRLEMVRRIKDEIADYVVQLGTDGRLLSRCSSRSSPGAWPTTWSTSSATTSPESKAGYSAEEAIANLEALDSTELLDPVGGAKALGFPVVGDALDSSISPHGYRLLSKVPRLPGAIVDRLIDHFGSLQKLLAAGLDDLQEVDGVGEGRARLVREGLSRLAESSILERYV
jgi:diadenylate cyclase